MSEATGRCLCGEVSYRVVGALRPIIACHCSQCRRSSGHYVSATSAPREAVTIVGTPAWYASSPEARRGFCARCGSPLFWDGPGRNLSIHAGSLDPGHGLRTKGHIFCADKGEYYEIADNLPQRGGADAEFTTQAP